MSTRQHASEERLAELACAHLRGIRRAHVLIGGLGFGFTLKAALRAIAADATVVVAEILAAVIDWNRNPAYPFAADALADPRVIVRQQDTVAANGTAPPYGPGAAEPYGPPLPIRSSKDSLPAPGSPW